MYKHISKEERDQISILFAKGQSQAEIATTLNRHKSTISRELKRNSSPNVLYLSQHAQQKSEVRSHKAHKKQRLKNNKIRNYVENGLRKRWSPDAIAGRLKLINDNLSISHEAIYQYIYEEKPELGLYLPRGGVKRRPKSNNRHKNKTKILNRISISKRPEAANSRLEFGHYEADSIVSRQSKTCLNVLVERKSRYTFISILENKTAEETLKAIIFNLSSFSDFVLSVSYDNGTEFAYHQEINLILESNSFFCEPYHSWEKGSVENRNGLIRRFLPKKTDFSKISKQVVANIQEWINNRPMKCLNYLTPKEVYELELNVALNG